MRTKHFNIHLPEEWDPLLTCGLIADVSQDVRAVPDVLLLRLHGRVQHCPGNHVR